MGRSDFKSRRGTRSAAAERISGIRRGQQAVVALDAGRRGVGPDVWAIDARDRTHRQRNQFLPRSVFRFSLEQNSLNITFFGEGASTSGTVRMD